MVSQGFFPALYLGIALFSAKCIMHIFKFLVDFGECQATAANELLVFCNLKQHTECLRCQRQCISLWSATTPSDKSWRALGHENYPGGDIMIDCKMYKGLYGQETDVLSDAQ